MPLHCMRLPELHTPSKRLWRPIQSRQTFLICEAQSAAEFAVASTGAMYRKGLAGLRGCRPRG